MVRHVSSRRVEKNSEAGKNQGRGDRYVCR